MPDPSIGFNSASTLNGFALASNGAALNSTSSGEKNITEKQEVKVFRYPYNLKIDRDTDYLEIKIARYQAPGLIEKNTDTTQGFGGYGSAPTGTSSNTKAAAPENFGGSLENPKAYISLPIPQSISDTAQVTWGEDTLDPLSAFAVGLGGNLMTGNLNLRKSAKDILDTAKLGFDEKTKNALIGAISGQAYGALGGNVSVTSLIARASGQVFNPNLELLFQGVTLRSFPFTFDFVPRNSTEAKVVKNIIRTFKQSMTAKSSSSQNDIAAGVFIGAPDVFQLTYKRGPNAHPFLNKFKPMALTNMQLNYTGSNTYATYADGTPVHINMSLTFTELNPIYAEDYKENDIGVGY